MQEIKIIKNNQEENIQNKRNQEEIKKLTQLYKKVIQSWCCG